MDKVAEVVGPHAQNAANVVGEKVVEQVVTPLIQKGIDWVRAKAHLDGDPKQP